MEKRITYVGLDVHKDTIAVALAERANGAKCVSMARSPTPHLQLVSKLARGGHRLRFCYEAGPCGYGIQRTEMAARSAAHEHHLVVEACRVCSPDYRQGSLADRTAGSKICCCWVTKSGRSGPDVYG